MQTNTKWQQSSFEQAVAQAQKSLEKGGVPVGAALDKGGKLIAVEHNERVQQGDPIAHGEMSCIRQAGRQKTYKDTVLYTTLAPCMMCAGTIVQFGIPLVVVGESQTFSGEIEFLQSRGVKVVILNDERCVRMMSEFQNRYPEVWAEDIEEN